MTIAISRPRVWIKAPFHEHGTALFQKLNSGQSLYQGAAQIELWTGKKAPVEAMRQELLNILAEQG